MLFVSISWQTVFLTSFYLPLSLFIFNLPTAPSKEKAPRPYVFLPYLLFYLKSKRTARLRLFRNGLCLQADGDQYPRCLVFVIIMLPTNCRPSSAIFNHILTYSPRLKAGDSAIINHIFNILTKELKKSKNHFAPFRPVSETIRH